MAPRPPPETPDQAKYRDRLDRFHALSPDQRLDLALALLRRDDGIRRADGIRLLRAAFPHAAQEVVARASYHLYQELPGSFRDFLAWLETSVEAEGHEPHSGLQFDILYHLYGWLQMEALIPYGRQDVLDELDETIRQLKDGNAEGAIGMLRNLRERIEGDTTPPSVER